MNYLVESENKAEEMSAEYWCFSRYTSVVLSLLSLRACSKSRHIGEKVPILIRRIPIPQVFDPLERPK